MAVDDVQRIVTLVVALGLVLALFTLWLSDLRRTSVPLFRGGWAFALGGISFVYHSTVAITDVSGWFGGVGMLATVLSVMGAYRLSSTSQRFFGESRWFSSTRRRCLVILLAWAVFAAWVWSAVFGSG